MVTGVITATAAFLVNLAVENIAGFKFYATLTLLSRGHWIGSYLAYVAMNGTLVLLAVGGNDTHTHKQTHTTRAKHLHTYKPCAHSTVPTMKRSCLQRGYVCTTV